MSDAMVLVTALIGYRGLQKEQLVQYMHESIVVEPDGRQAIELSIFEKKIGLPDDFFANAIKEASAAATTETSQ
ncbi:hypothetical protein P9847_01360 [Paenibacillus chibensis]|uniref:Uncharacterized protein n=1 Tax=Paenibacillus chibensis TaxID=59846 RepID=A0ABU6PM53_9BACL|nr:hypothetical protein [Paenibacillus chibensis]